VQLKTILNRVERHGSFVYGEPRFEHDWLVVPVRPRANGKPCCSGCGRRCGTYDTSRDPRRFQFVPLWGLQVWFEYAMRRANCPRCGVKVERVPWADGKSPITTSFARFLAKWAKRMSWQEVASTFQTTWECVYRAVQTVVAWGLAHRDLSNIQSIGVDEIMWHRGQKYLTVVYEIESGRRRLLWVGEERKEKTIRKFFDWFGDRAADLKFVCSDMWKPYLKVVAQMAGQAVHILDRYHIVANLNKAVDLVRAKEVKRLKSDGYEPILKRSRWLFLKRPENLTTKQASNLGDLLQYNLRTVKAYLLAQELHRLWTNISPTWAGKFLDQWCRNVMRTRLDPMKKVARSMRDHRELILNWFRASGEISAGAVEGLNNKAKVTFRKSYGFRTFHVAETALYHTLGKLPEPEDTHRFC
jgi:transposase